ncbi:hypothetical protein BpHYR1_034586 [Brachionus plicatilis]|uniref:Uncharacterized protein n=1 Tax=Brachionus plicatilis TaxID=10195 RepID=A0A3M7RGE2_BRAPC|nr:hypothetical protein BpHYR1_034586 [Brachionus plicatilis]
MYCFLFIDREAKVNSNVIYLQHYMYLTSYREYDLLLKPFFLSLIKFKLFEIQISYYRLNQKKIVNGLPSPHKQKTVTHKEKFSAQK